MAREDSVTDRDRSARLEPGDSTVRRARGDAALAEQVGTQDRVRRQKVTAETNNAVYGSIKIAGVLLSKLRPVKTPLRTSQMMRFSFR